MFKGESAEGPAEDYPELTSFYNNPNGHGTHHGGIPQGQNGFGTGMQPQNNVPQMQGGGSGKIVEDPKYKELRIPCPRHENYYVTHGCSYIDCQRDILFCSACLLDQLEHATEHKSYIYPLSRFIVEFYGNVHSVRETVRPYEEVNNNRASHISFYNKFIQEQKEYINAELRNLLEQFQYMIEKLRVTAVNEFETLEKQLSGHYEALGTYFQTSEINFIQINHHTELAQKLQNFPLNQMIPYLTNIRSSMQSLRDPAQSALIRNMNRVSSIISSYKKKNEKNALALSQLSTKNLKIIYSEAEDRIQQYINDVARPPEVATSSFGSGGNPNYENSNPPSPLYGSSMSRRGMGGNGIRMGSPPRELSPGGRTSPSQIGSRQSPRSQTSSYLKNSNSTALSTSPIHGGSRVGQFSNINNSNIILSNPNAYGAKVGPVHGGITGDNPKGAMTMTAPGSSLFPSQKNVVIHNSGVDAHAGSNISKFNLSLESYFEGDDVNSALSTVCLSSNLIAVAGKDSVIRIFRINKNQTGRLDLKLLSVYQNKSEPSGIWCMSKLTPASTQFSQGSISYFASGGENGNIYIWKFDLNNYNTFENKTLIVLNGGYFVEIITTILDLEDGNHLVCGDSNGTIVLWDYLYGKMKDKFNVHSGQINSMTLYNNKNNFAAGGYDGLISLWNINKTRSTTGGYGGVSAADEDSRVEISCVKVIPHNYYVYSLTSTFSRKHGSNTLLVVVDSQKKCKVLDGINYMMVNETDMAISADPVFDVLNVDFINDRGQDKSYFLCLTRSQLIVLDGTLMQPIQYFDHNDLFNNNVGVTMSTCYKAVILPKPVETIQNTQYGFEKETAFYFAIVDQSNKTNRIVSIFRMAF